MRQYRVPIPATEWVFQLIVNIMILSILIGYSIALAASILMILRTKRAAHRIERKMKASRSSRHEVTAVKRGPNEEAMGVAVWAGFILFVVGSLSLRDLDYVFRGEISNIVTICVLGLMLIILPPVFHSIMSKGQEIAVFSERGIMTIGSITGFEHEIPWYEIDEFTYTSDETGFSKYALSYGKRTILIDPSGQENKTIIELAVKHVPKSMWAGKDIQGYLAKHFEITIERNP